MHEWRLMAGVVKVEELKGDLTGPLSVAEILADRWDWAMDVLQLIFSATCVLVGKELAIDCRQIRQKQHLQPYSTTNEWESDSLDQPSFSAPLRNVSLDDVARVGLRQENPILATWHIIGCLPSRNGWKNHRWTHTPLIVPPKFRANNQRDCRLRWILQYDHVGYRWWNLPLLVLHSRDYIISRGHFEKAVIDIFIAQSSFNAVHTAKSSTMSYATLLQASKKAHDHLKPDFQIKLG